MSFGKKLLLAAVLYTLPLVIAYIFGLLAEQISQIALVLAGSSFLGFLYYFFFLIGFGPGLPFATTERLGLDAATANRIDQMPSLKNQSASQAVSQMLGIYLLLLVGFTLISFLVW